MKEHDIFGHSVALNFKQEGDTHTTVVGGFFSVFIKIAITIYVVMNFMKMIFYEGDSVSLSIKKIDLDDAGQIKYDGSDVLLFWSLRDTSQGNSPLFLDDPRINPNPEKKLRPYVNISFIQEKVDW